MVMAEAKPRFEMPTGLSYASIRRGRTDIYSQIFNKYCPAVVLETMTEIRRKELEYGDLPLEGDGHKACTEAKEAHAKAIELAEVEGAGPIGDYCPHKVKTLVPDPDVIWVGRLLDGLIFSGVIETRKIAKNLINNIPAGRTFRESGTAGQFTGGGIVRIEFKAVAPRAEMYRALVKGTFDNQPTVKKLIENGEAPTINMGTIIKDAEPGEILNSPDVVKPEQVTAGEVDMWEAGETEVMFEPSIRLDNRYGLHYLKRGDQVTISGSGWPRPRVTEFLHKWVLRPPSEGPSLVQQDAGGDDVIQLAGNIRA